MPDGIRWVGLDVHARESTIAIFDQATGEVVTRRVVGRPHELLPWLRWSVRRGWCMRRARPAMGSPPGASEGDRARGVRAGEDRAPGVRSGQDRLARRDPPRAAVGRR
jgi:hypothetical protein